MKEELNSEEVFGVCQAFIKGMGYACRLNIEEEIQKYLMKNNYIYLQREGYYFLDSKFFLKFFWKMY